VGFVELGKWLVAACSTGIVLLVLACANPVNKRDAKPELSMVSDTMVSVKDSLFLTVHTNASGGNATGYTWWLDAHRLVSTTSADSVCRLFFTISDTGKHIVTVTGISGGNIPSDPETTKVTVLLNPPVVHCVTKDTAIYANDTIVIIANGVDPNGPIRAYYWQIDTGAVALTSVTGTLTYFFGARGETHRVRVAAMDDDSIMSAQDSVFVRVIADSPEITVAHDTAIPINDTLNVRGIRLDTFATTVHWLWARNGTAFLDTTSTGLFAMRFGRNEAGVRRILVKAIDNHRIESNIDSVRVQVHLDPPVVSIVHDTIVPINDPAVFHAHGSDTNGQIVKYVWALDGKHFDDTTVFDSVSHVYSRADTGLHIIVQVKAIDDDTVESNVDSVRVHLFLGPPVVSIVHDTIVPINDPAVFHVHGSDTNGHIIKYVWALDGKHFDDTTVFDSVSHVYSRADTVLYIIVRVKAIDDDTVESNVDSVRVTVRLKPSPSVAVTHDTTVFIDDSFSVAATGRESTSKSAVVAYVWAIDKVIFGDTTKTGVTALRFSRADTGRHLVRVKAVDRDTMESAPDSMVVHVLLGAPVVRAMKDTAVFINDTAFLRASGIDTNGSVVRYVWALDGPSFTDTTTDGILKKVWPEQDTGLHVVKVKVIDNDTIASRPDSCTVRVRLGMPVVRAIHDTNATWGDTVVVAVNASDTNGTLLKYLWTSSDGSGTWTDSATTGALRVTSNIHTRKRVVVGARDDDGLVAKDTFFIDFKAVRCSVSVQGSKNRDTVVLHSHNSKQVKTPLSLFAQRQDGIADTFTFSLLSGLSPSALSEIYRGKDTVCTLTTLDTGTYYWKLIATDPHNDTAATSLSALTVMIQNRVCFVGHSIAVGFGCQSGMGGFRRMIIDTLRARAGMSRRIGCEGPLTTSYLLPAGDDSCLAVGGKTCAAIYDSLEVNPSTNADLWVYMNGVNDWYACSTYYNKYGTKNYAALTIDSIHGRNPQSEIYVLNGLPFPPDTIVGFNRALESAFKQNLPNFNHMLDSVVTLRRQNWFARGQGGVWLVNVYDSMATTPVSDSAYNPVYFVDFLHPNQLGYDVMGRQLLRTMKAVNSRFYK
jgi:hypothetical protein